MVSRRYLYYLLLGTQLAMSFPSVVPYILIEDRYHGAPAALIVGLFFGVVIQSLALYAFSAFPGQTLNDILTQGGVPKVVIKCLNAYLIVTEYFLGLLLGFQFTKLFSMNPAISVSSYAILGLFVAFVILAARQTSLTILFILEILFVIILPFFALFVITTIFNKQVSWDAIEYGADFVKTIPTWGGIAAAFSLFTGFIPLMALNKEIKWRTANGDFKLSRIFWVTAFLGFILLLNTYFVPIGYFGMNGSGSLNHIWYLVADSVRMEWYIFGRFSYIFLLLTTIFTISSIMGSWFISLYFAKSLFIKNSRKEWLILAGFAAVPFGFMYVGDLSLWVKVSRVFLFGRMVGSCCLVVFLIYCSRRMRKRYV
ncbi:hypothetical protein DMN77_20455 [Paenibacillus sp. 79R4]|uniref:hypothetical protein n=1 Tax=Paenibacillus sp. 79R4 TaxID=2212847 RepID=UPI0015C0BEDC|nr:hypothetical protein [Paenibacillus sp. 79R4]NWL89925.1 hypothetical protein [Paenibacillus sp. 79R4]